MGYGAPPFAPPLPEGSEGVGPDLGGDWHDVRIRVELETDEAVGGGGEWDTGEWDVDVWGGDEFVWADLTDDYQHAEIRASSRPRWGDHYQAALATLVLDNTSGDYSPSNPAGAELTIGRRIRIVAVFDGIEYPRIAGIVKAVRDTDTPGQGPRATVTIRGRLGGLAAPNRVALASPVGAGELTGARVARILSGMGVGPDDRIVNTGTEPVQGTTLAGSPLSELYLVADSEGGVVYEDGAGRVVFRSRPYVDAIEAGDPAVTLAGYGLVGVSPDGCPWLTYSNLTPETDLDAVVNIARIGRAGGSLQTAVDAGSVKRYRTQRTVTRTDLLNTSDTWPHEWASRIVARRSAAFERVTAVNLTGGSAHDTPDAEATHAVLAIEQGSKVRVRRLVGGNVLVADALVQGWVDVFHPGRPHEYGVRSDTWSIELATDQARPATVEE